MNDSIIPGTEYYQIPGVDDLPQTGTLLLYCCIAAVCILTSYYNHGAKSKHQRFQCSQLIVSAVHLTTVLVYISDASISCHQTKVKLYLVLYHTSSVIVCTLDSIRCTCTIKPAPYALHNFISSWHSSNKSQQNQLKNKARNLFSTMYAAYKHPKSPLGSLHRQS